jgi:hypothetical protein
VTLDSVRAAVVAARSAFRLMTFRMIDMDEDITAMEETVSCIRPGQVFTTGWCYFAGVSAHHRTIRRACRFDTRPADYSTDDEGRSVEGAGHYVEPPAITALQAYCPRRLPMEELLENSTLVFEAATLLNTFMSTHPHNSNMLQIRDAHRRQLERMRVHTPRRATAGRVNLLAGQPAAAASNAPLDLPPLHVAPDIAPAVQPAAFVPMVPPHAPLALPAAAVDPIIHNIPRLRRSARRTGNADMDLASNMVLLHALDQVSEQVCGAVQAYVGSTYTTTDTPWGVEEGEDRMDCMEINDNEPLRTRPPTPQIGAAVTAAGGVVHLATTPPEMSRGVAEWRAQYPPRVPREEILSPWLEKMSRLAEMSWRTHDELDRQDDERAQVQAALNHHVDAEHGEEQAMGVEDMDIDE